MWTKSRKGHGARSLPPCSSAVIIGEGWWRERLCGPFASFNPISQTPSSTSLCHKTTHTHTLTHTHTHTHTHTQTHTNTYTHTHREVHTEKPLTAADGGKRERSQT